MNLDDPNLTAYALGEMTDREELAAMETWLKENAEGRAYVAETRETARFLQETMISENAPSLTSEQRQALLRETEKPSNVVEMPLAAQRRKWSNVGLAALAACLAAAPLLPWATLLRQRTAPTVAINTETEQAKGKDDDTVTIETAQLQMESTGKKEYATVTRKEYNEMDKEMKKLSGVLGVQHRPLAIVTPPAAPAKEVKPMNSLAGVAESEETRQAFNAGKRMESLPAEADSAAVSAYAALPPAQGPVTISFSGDDGQRAREKQDHASNTEAYELLPENGFLTAKDHPLSTFSIDVDTASYANVRRFLTAGHLPPRDAVRIEEMLNYFTYNYANPTDDAPFSTNLEVADCPWQPQNRLVRVGLKAREIAVADRKTANLVFLIDISGSMDQPSKLPLLKQSLRLLIDQLAENDTVALAVYAGQSGLVLPATSNKDALRAALENLRPGGSTNGGSGIQLAYEEAAKHFVKDGVNRVILATDGDFNVGISSQDALVDLITAKAKSGVFLTVLGFGTGNVKDSTMEKLADKGNGNYAYIDSLREGKKVLVEQMNGTLVTIAKDVKIQVEFNPAQVSSYRLVGYENRALKKEDFNDDRKDAGEIGSGHTVTALYEVVPANVSGTSAGEVDSLKYAPAVTPDPAAAVATKEMLTVKLRYKEPSGDTSRKLEFPWIDKGAKLSEASADFRFASAVAEAGMLLRDSANRHQASWDALISRAADALGEDRGGYRAEFVDLAKKAHDLSVRSGSQD